MEKRYFKILKQTIGGGLLVSATLTVLSCSFIRTVKWEKLFRPLEDFHVQEKTLYDQSPYSRLIDGAFVDNWAQCEPEKQFHYLNILETGEDALLARVHWIRLAKKSILIQTFIWDDDESGRYVMDELIKAARRGVQVRVLIDALGATKNQELLAYFADADPNLELRVYNPSSDRIRAGTLQTIGDVAFRLDDMNKRMHNKTLIVDDQMVIMGGRNYQNDYFDRNRYRNFLDRDVLVIGPVVKSVTDSFSQYWAFYQTIKAEDLADVGRMISQKSYRAKITPRDFEFGELFKDIEDRLTREFIQSHFVDQAYPVRHVVFVVDVPGKNNVRGLSNGGEASDELMDILKQSKEELFFQTPYLVLDNYLLKAVKKIRRKKSFVDIIISTNSLAATDHITAYAQSFKQKSLFVDELKFRIFELRPIPFAVETLLPNYSQYSEDFFPQADESILEDVLAPVSLPQKKRYVCIHAKSFVIDEEVAWVGSFNLDPRSAHLNTELGLIVYDKTFARALKKNMELFVAQGNSWVVGRKPGIPVVKQVNVIIDRIVSQLPIGDVWPFNHITLFELKDGKEPMPFYAREFYENYRDVGPFPEVSLPQGQIQLMLLKAFIGIAKPLI